MSKLFSDGFDRYGSTSTTELAMKWSTATSFSVLTSTTAWNSGQAVTSTFDATTVFDTTSNETTIFFSIRIGHIGGTSTSDTVTLRFLDSSSVQTAIVWKSDGSISCYTGDTTGTLIQTFTSMFPAAQGIWDSWQGKIVISNTTGSIELRKSGNPTDVINLSNVNTRGGSTNNYVNKLRLATAGGSQWYVDDFFVNNNDGIAPSGWIGDIRCIEQRPASSSLAQLSVVPTSIGYGRTGSGSTKALSANTCYVFPANSSVPISPLNGTFNKITLNFSASVTGNVKCALYTCSSNGSVAAPSGILVATTNAVSNPSAGFVDFTFPSPPSVTIGQGYCVGFLSDAACTLVQASNTNLMPAVAQTYASGFPTQAPTSGGLGDPYAVATVTIDNSGATYSSDSDTSTVSSSTVGQEDLYGLSSLSGTQVSIAGVEYFAQVKKSDAGSRTGGLQLSQGGTEITAASNASLNQTYAYLSQFRTTDTSGAPLTATTINNTLIGPKVIA